MNWFVDKLGPPAPILVSDGKSAPTKGNGAAPQAAPRPAAAAPAPAAAPESEKKKKKGWF